MIPLVFGVGVLVRGGLLRSLSLTRLLQIRVNVAAVVVFVAAVL